MDREVDCQRKENKIIEMNYFALPSVSNSNLIALRKAFYLAEETFDPSQVYKFGSLVDAMLTEPNRVNYWYFSLDEDGKQVYYTPEEFELAKALTKQCMKDPIIVQFVNSGQSQHVIERLMKFTFEGNEYEIMGRCKFDSLLPKIKTGLSYKTTACTTRKAFIQSIEHFHYDQQEAWYMDLAEIDRDWIKAVSKNTKEIFTVAVQRGDELYERGRQKYSLWAYKWLMFVDGFKEEMA